MDQQIQGDAQDNPGPPALDRPRNKGESWSQQARESATAYAMERMADGDSLEQACREMDINPGTVWHWIFANPELQLAYESSKIVRARGFIERAIDEIQNNPDTKAGELRSRGYMRLAALLNPKEFSDKLHAATGKQGPAGRVSFNLTFNGTEPKEMGQITVIEDSSEG